MTAIVTDPAATRYNVGDRVRSRSGEVVGDVIAVVTKLSGGTRYVVEDARGRLYVFSAVMILEVIEEL